MGSPVYDQEDVVVLNKSTNISLGDNLYMMILYYYNVCKTDRAKTFYRCSVRVDSFENWKKTREFILSENPAEEFRTSLFGIDGNFRVYYVRHLMNRADMYRWIEGKFSPSKVNTMNEFLVENSSRKEKFLENYEINGNKVHISEFNNFTTGLWFSADKEHVQRKKYGTIIH